MGFSERQRLYRELERLRGRPVVAYVTSGRMGAAGNIAADCIAELLLQLDALPSGTTELDLLLVSNGGDATVAWRVVSLIRERVKKFAVLVPQAAFSAATLIALGADEIVMHPHGNLGPTDPQISTKKAAGKDGAPAQAIGFGSEDLAAFLRFAKDSVGITNQTELGAVFGRFCDEVGSVAIGVAARSTQLAVVMGERLLQLHMRGDADKAKARAISEKLTRDFFHHGYPVSRSEARSIGLPVAAGAPDIEQVMWSIWLSISDELSLREPVNDVSIVRKAATSAPLFVPVPHTVVQQADGSLQLVVSQPVVSVPPVPFEFVHALMESARLATRFVTRGTLIAAKMQDQNLRISKFPDHVGWITLEQRPEPVVPEKPESMPAKKKTSRTLAKERK